MHTDAVLTRLKYNLIAEFLLLLFFGSFLVRAMRPRFRFDIAKRSLRIGVPIMLSAIFAMLYNLSDRFFLEKYSGFNVLAVYNLGVTIAGSITILSASFQSIYAPIFFKEKDPVVNLQNVKKILKIAVPALLLLGVSLVLVSWAMVHFNIINKEYQGVISLLPLLLASAILQGVTHMYINFMTYFEVTHIIVAVNVVSNIINVILNIILIPVFSIYGAAFATVVATAVAFVAFFFYAKRKVKDAVSKAQVECAPLGSYGVGIIMEDEGKII
jgi:O-antigen/teichoic acid export membrane protein